MKYLLKNYFEGFIGKDIIFNFREKTYSRLSEI